MFVCLYVYSSVKTQNKNSFTGKSTNDINYSSLVINMHQAKIPRKYNKDLTFHHIIVYHNWLIERAIL